MRRQPRWPGRLDTGKSGSRAQTKPSSGVNGFSLRLADARGSLTPSESALAFLSRDCKGAVRSPPALRTIQPGQEIAPEAGCKIQWKSYLCSSGLLDEKQETLMKLKSFGFFLLLTLEAQTLTSGNPGFDVSSVKPANAPGRPEIGNSNGRGYAKNATLKMIMATAYQVPAFQISGGPGWADSDRFDVEGKASDPKTGYIQLRLMMQALLEDRFHLKVHRATRVSSVYSLVVARGGVKMTPSADQISPDASGSASSPADGPPRGGALMGPGMFIANASPVSVIARTLTPEMERPVLDRTNLNGRFDVRLEWMPDARFAGGTAPANAANLPTIFTALREQLGLELKSDRGPVEFLVIDSVEKPLPN